MYRVLIAVAIASLVIQWSSYINLRPVAVVLVVLAMASSGMQVTRRLFGVVQGTGMWSGFPRWRRFASVGTLVVIVASLIFVPFPRYRRVEGRIEATEVAVAYVTNGGIVDTVDVEVGAIVEAGQRLATIRNPEVQFETIRLEGQLRLASLRRQASERSALDRPEASRQWEILRAAESATVTSVDSARLKEQHNAIVASVGGMVLPPVLRTKQRAMFPSEPNSGSLASHLNSVEHLASLDGLGVESDDEWCRISPCRARRVLFHLSSEDFQHVNILDKVRVRETVGHSSVYDSEIVSISPVVRDEKSVTDQAWFHATCPLAKVDDESFLLSMGTSCDVVIRLADRSFAQDCLQWITVWLRG
jgi:hypothetical protein